MGLKRIGDLPSQHYCRHPQHNPPGHIVLRPGVYEHTCPGCKRTLRFAVHPTHLDAGPDPLRIPSPYVPDVRDRDITWRASPSARRSRSTWTSCDA